MYKNLNHENLKSLSIEELEEIAQLLRDRILEVVSKNGGHLSSSLGAVEIILAMHSVFDCRTTPFIFDVSHQAYAHKLLSGRFESFESLRKFKGISGFCNPNESNADYFIAGHSSTSISLGVGAAKSRLLNETNKLDSRYKQAPIAMIGDGSMSAGLVYEALNELGDRKYPMIIILNDNEMSISKPIGAISKYLSTSTSHPIYQNMRNRAKKFLTNLPKSATYLAKRFEESFKLITPGILFEELGIDYIGPIDGHNLNELITCLKRAKDMNKPVLIHAQTTKGKGYKIAEGPFEKWHGVSPFDLDSGEALKKKSSILSPTEVYANTLSDLAESNPKIVGVSAAMPNGVGIGGLIEKYPNRFWDVGIAEQHAVLSMAALAKEGFIPFVSIYSTFLQRSFDQMIHDIGILNIPVRFSIDRAGIVGEDGETHQGLFDIAYMRMIPNFTLFAPRDNETLKRAIKFAEKFNSSPCAYRYPRGGFVLDSMESNFEINDFVLDSVEVLDSSNEKIVLIGYGNGVGRAYQTKLELQKNGIESSLVDLRFAAPIPSNLESILEKAESIFIFSDSYKACGVASAISEKFNLFNFKNLKIFHSFELESKFVTHGSLDDVVKFLELDSVSLCKKIMNLLG